MFNEFYYVSEEFDVCVKGCAVPPSPDVACRWPSRGELAAWIHEAASEVVRRIVAANGGVRPRSLNGWLASCRRIGITTVGIAKPSTFTARIIEFPHDQWTIFYNSSAPRMFRRAILLMNWQSM